MSNKVKITNPLFGFLLDKASSYQPLLKDQAEKLNESINEQDSRAIDGGLKDICASVCNDAMSTFFAVILKYPSTKGKKAFVPTLQTALKNFQTGASFKIVDLFPSLKTLMETFTKGIEQEPQYGYYKDFFDKYEDLATQYDSIVSKATDIAQNNDITDADLDLVISKTSKSLFNELVTNMGKTNESVDSETLNEDKEDRLNNRASKKVLRQATELRNWCLSTAVEISNKKQDPSKEQFTSFKLYSQFLDLSKKLSTVQKEVMVDKDQHDEYEKQVREIGKQYQELKNNYEKLLQSDFKSQQKELANDRKFGPIKELMAKAADTYGDLKELGRQAEIARGFDHIKSVDQATNKETSVATIALKDIVKSKVQLAEDKFPYEQGTTGKDSVKKIQQLIIDATRSLADKVPSFAKLQKVGPTGNWKNITASCIKDLKKGFRLQDKTPAFTQELYDKLTNGYKSLLAKQYEEGKLETFKDSNGKVFKVVKESKNLMGFDDFGKMMQEQLDGFDVTLVDKESPTSDSGSKEPKKGAATLAEVKAKQKEEIQKSFISISSGIKLKKVTDEEIQKIKDEVKKEYNEKYNIDLLIDLGAKQTTDRRAYYFPGYCLFSNGRLVRTFDRVKGSYTKQGVEWDNGEKSTWEDIKKIKIPSVWRARIDELYRQLLWPKMEPKLRNKQLFVDLMSQTEDTILNLRNYFQERYKYNLYQMLEKQTVETDEIRDFQSKFRRVLK